MAYWKENINVEVLLPFDTPNCTTTWYWVMFPIVLEETWHGSGVWMYNADTYTEHHINICGRMAYLTGGRIERTTNHLMACRAYSDLDDPSRSSNEHFRVRLVSRDKQLTDQERRSMRLHSIDYGSYIYKPKKQ